MTDAELFTRYINKFGHKFPEFNQGLNYWDELTKGYKWFMQHVPEGTYSEVMERYYRSVLEIVSIEEIMKEGGFNE